MEMRMHFPELFEVVKTSFDWIRGEECDRVEHCYLETVIIVILFPYYFMVVSLYQQ